MLGFLESPKKKKEVEADVIIYHRKPTKSEIKFGEGTTHYKDFETVFCWNDKTDSPKRWLICPIDGLRYYY